MFFAKDAAANHWAVYFQGSELPLSCNETWSGSMYRFHIVLQEHQVIVLMLVE